MHDPMIFIFAYERFANRVYALAAEREREECAKLCDDLIGTRAMAVHCADAIRSKGNT